MSTVIRYDRAELLAPTRTPQGFLRADGIAARVGIYEYRNPDGSIRRELRPPEEVGHADALASFDGASVTLGHPAEEVTADNVRAHEVGTVSGVARFDGARVVTSTIIKDGKAIKQVERGLRELSPGYRMRLDVRPGADRKYAYPGNPDGRWDAIQRDIRVNHLAIVERARGGADMRLRLDAAEDVRYEIRRDGHGKLTTAVDGHQHLVMLIGHDGAPVSAGCTTWATSEGAERTHEHPWVRGADGSIIIGESDGHTHSILVEPGRVDTAPSGVFDRLPRGGEGGVMATANQSMTPEEQLRSLREQLTAAEAKLTASTSSAQEHARRADAAEARVVTLAQEIEALRAQIASAAEVRETEAIARERTRADEAESRVRQYGDRFASAVAARVALERKASMVMGADYRLDGLSDREILSTVVKRLDARADVSASVSDAFLAGRFESLIELHNRTARDLGRMGEVIRVETPSRVDALEEERAKYRNQWQEPLPNSREARASRGA